MAKEDRSRSTRVGSKMGIIQTTQEIARVVGRNATGSEPSDNILLVRMLFHVWGRREAEGSRKTLSLAKFTPILGRKKGRSFRKQQQPSSMDCYESVQVQGNTQSTE